MTLPLDILAVFALLAGGAWLADFLSMPSNRALTLTEAVGRSILYVVVALIFGGYLIFFHGDTPASLFFAGYVMEKVLSIDNLLVFAAIFMYYRIPAAQQPWILSFGIAGAIVFRLIFIAVGVGSLWLFGWMTELIFGLLVGWSAWQLWRGGDGDDAAPYDQQWYVRLAKRFSVTPAIICLITIEISDVMFAFDSVPVVIAITQDPMLIFASMIFAILGLRAMYLVLDAMRSYLVHLDKAVIAVLAFISAKLIAHATLGWHLDPNVSLGIVLAMLGAGVLASRLAPQETEVA